MIPINSINNVLKKRTIKIYEKTWNHSIYKAYTITGKRKRRYKDGDENNV